MEGGRVAKGMFVRGRGGEAGVLGGQDRASQSLAGNPVNPCPSEDGVPPTHLCLHNTPTLAPVCLPFAS